LSAPDRALVEEMATTYLWEWTLRQFGECPVVLRPCREDSNCVEFSTFWGRGPYPWGSAGGSWPVLVSGKWYNLRGCACSQGCSCAIPNSLALPGPVLAVIEVMIDGVVVAPGAYRLDGNLLIRTDGLSWPACQDLAAPVTAPNTWQISYTRGAVVPSGGQIAAGVLACELAKALCRDASCALPQRVQTITRQGVTIAMIDSGVGLEKGQTGIWLIDSWVASITQPVQPSRVYSPDVPRNRSGRLSSL
jgi:hypothetical protein